MKVKELTLEQIKNICNDHYPSCRKDGVKCPLYNKTISCDTIISVIRSALRHNPNALEERVNLLGETEDKSTPKKVIKYSYADASACPSCGLAITADNYCKYCGQALDWSDEDDK